MISDPYPLSVFLRDLRQIEDDKAIRDFILNGSREIKIMDAVLAEKVDRRGPRLFQFFVAHTPDLCNIPIEQKDEDLYQWGHFFIKFRSQRIKEDCMAYVTNYKDTKEKGEK